MRLKKKMFTHDDLDGAACATLVKFVFGDNVDIEYCSRENINEKIKHFLTTDYMEMYSQVFITDISVNKELADKIKNVPIQFNLIDHHKTEVWLNEYDFANVIVSTNINLELPETMVDGEIQNPKRIERLECGASLFYKFLFFNQLIQRTRVLDKFVELVRSFDTWDWMKTKNKKAKDLDTVFQIIGIELFVEKYLEQLREKADGFYIFPEHDMLVYYFDKKNKTLIQQKMKNVRIIEDKYGNKVGCVFCDNKDLTSMLGDKICDELDVDYAAIVYEKGVSLRSIKKDVSEIAKECGGGGHEHSAGFRQDNLMKLIESFKFMK